MKRPEDQLQAAIVSWWNLQFHVHRKCLVAVPNELVGRAGNYARAMAKPLGVVSGAPDLLIFASSGRVVCVELKTLTGRQSQSQKEFQAKVESLGHQYYLIRSLDAFIELANSLGFQ